MGIDVRVCICIKTEAVWLGPALWGGFPWVSLGVARDEQQTNGEGFSCYAFWFRFALFNFFCLSNKPRRRFVKCRLGSKGSLVGFLWTTEARGITRTPFSSRALCALS